MSGADSTPACAFMEWTRTTPLFSNFYKSQPSLLSNQAVVSFQHETVGFVIGAIFFFFFIP